MQQEVNSCIHEQQTELLCLGCLFIDEAWALGGDEMGNSDSFSREAVRTLLRVCENIRILLVNVSNLFSGGREQSYQYSGDIGWIPGTDCSVDAL